MKIFQVIKIFLFFLPAIYILGLSGNVKAQSAVTCHCFTERDYNPADRFAADDYILATSFNSLLARYFAVSKGQIVMLKMKQGVPQDDLLIGLKVSQIGDGNINNLLRLRRAGKTWQEIIAGMEQHDRLESDPLLKRIIAGVPVDEAGRGIADEIIGRFYAIPADQINKLRKTGLSEKEITLLFILVHVGNQNLETLLKQQREQSKSWSEIAHGLGIDPKAAGRLILAYPAKQINE